MRKAYSVQLPLTLTVRVLAKRIPALHSRFPIRVDFRDLNTDEMVEVAQNLVKQYGYQFGASLKDQLACKLSSFPPYIWQLATVLCVTPDIIDHTATQLDARESNAYLVDGLISKAIIKHATNV